MPDVSRVRTTALAQLTLLRLREFVREPEALFWGLAFPVLLAAGLGIAFRDQPPQPVAVATSSAELAQALAHDSQIVVRRLTPEAAGEALRVGRVGLIVEPGASSGEVVYRYDDTNPDARQARLLADRALQRAKGRRDPLTTQDRLVREPGARYIDFLVPGLVGMGIMGNAIWGLGFSIVDTRRRKLMKRLVATPMRRRDYLASFLLWRMCLLGIEAGVPIGFGVIAFGVPVRGSMIALAVICILGSLAFSTLGLLIAARPRTIEAVSGLMNVVMMPMWILSGVFFAADRFPAAAQPFIRALPLTALVEALRAHMLQGAALGAVAPQLATLIAWLVVCFAIALKVFRWK